MGDFRPTYGLAKLAVPAALADEGLLIVDFREALEHGGQLCAGCTRLGQELAVVPQQNVLPNHPNHGVQGKGGDLRSIREGAEAATGRGRTGIAPEDGPPVAGG